MTPKKQIKAERETKIKINFKDIKIVCTIDEAEELVRAIEQAIPMED